jgi:hypothetical protein
VRVGEDPQADAEGDREADVEGEVARGLTHRGLVRAPADHDDVDEDDAQRHQEGDEPDGGGGDRVAEECIHGKFLFLRSVCRTDSGGLFRPISTGSINERLDPTDGTGATRARTDDTTAKEYSPPRFDHSRVRR